MKLIIEDLVTSVKRRTLAPISQNTFVDQDIINVLNEEMESELVPFMSSIREDFFLRSQTVSLVASVPHYSVPERASGNALKDVWFLDSTGKRVRTIPRTEVHDLEAFVTTGAEPRAMFFRGDELYLTPTPNVSAGSLELWHYSRPNQLVSTSSCAKVTAVSTVAGTTTFTVDTDLTGSLSAGSLIDVIGGKSPYLLRYLDVAITAITSTTIAFASAGLSDESGSVTPAVGDYLCPAKQSCLPMLPDELHPILAQAAAVAILDSLGDLNKVGRAEGKLEKMKRNVLKLISNRVESEPEVVINRHGILASMSATVPVIYP